MNFTPQWIAGNGIEPIHEVVDHGMSPEELRKAALEFDREKAQGMAAWQEELSGRAAQDRRVHEGDQKAAEEARRKAAVEHARRQAILVEREKIAEERWRAEQAESRRIELEVFRAERENHPAARLKRAEATIADLVLQVAALRDRVLVLEGGGHAVTKLEDGNAAQA